jgi:hypothetical protein
LKTNELEFDFIPENSKYQEPKNDSQQMQGISSNITYDSRKWIAD